MNIVAPFSSLSEVDMLIHNGADELYCGVNTPEWEAYYGGNFWMNRRSPRGANLISLKETAEAVSKAHDHGVSVYVTVNTPFYPQGSIGYILRLCDKLTDLLQVDGLIVSDVNLMLHLEREEFPARLHLSSLGSVFNSHSVEFFQSLGIKRIILPRQLRLSEIRTIVENNKDTMEFEVFAINDGCYYEEGFCRTTHSLGPFCLTYWEIEAAGTDRNGPSSDDVSQNAEDVREFLWYQNNCGSSMGKTGIPNGPCSLCAFGLFREWGVKAMKIVGREASFIRKMSSLQLVKSVMDVVRNQDPPDIVADTARSLRNTPEYCKKGYMCYFRDE